MPGHLPGPDAARALPRPDRPVVLDVARVEVRRHPLAHDERVDPGEEEIERPVELADVPEREAAQETAQRRRVGDGMAAQLLLRLIAAHHHRVVETLAARDQRLAEGEDRLRRAVAAPPLLQRQRVKQLGQAERIGQLAHEHEPGMRGDLLGRAGDPDQRRSPCYGHHQECPPSARQDVSQRPW